MLPEVDFLLQVLSCLIKTHLPSLLEIALISTRDTSSLLTRISKELLTILHSKVTLVSSLDRLSGSIRDKVNEQCLIDIFETKKRIVYADSNLLNNKLQI